MTDTTTGDNPAQAATSSAPSASDVSPPAPPAWCAHTETPWKFANGAEALPLGIGTWAWGDSFTWGYKGYDPNFSDATIEEAWKVTLKHGITIIDTAEIYGSGLSEQIIAKLLKTATESDQKPLIATKFFPFPWRLFFPSSLLSALQGSLNRLQLPSVDLYQIHAATHFRSIEAVAEGLIAAYKQGLIKGAGVSNYNGPEVERMHAALSAHGVPLLTNQIEYSLLRRQPEVNGTIETCKRLGVAILAYSPLAMGLLTGKYNKENPFPRKGSRWWNRSESEEVIDRVVNKIKELAVKYERTPAQISLNWLICKGTIPIPGAKNAKQAADNAGALGWRLTAEDVAALDEVSHIGKTDFFRHA